MEWKGKRESANVQDARGESSGSIGKGGGGIGLMMTIGRLFGFKGIEGGDTYSQPYGSL
jgi:predicted metalloprotease